jgi:hypothetical protein
VAVVMSGNFAFLMNQYNLLQKSVEVVTADLTQPVAREGFDRGAFARQDNGPGNNSKPLFITTNRTDANNPLYKVVDEAGQSPLPYEDTNRNNVLDAGEDINGNGVIDKDVYVVDDRGNILYNPKNVTYLAPWFSGNFAGSGRTVNFTTDSYIWHPYPTTLEDTNANGVLDVGEDDNRNGALDRGNEQTYFGRSFYLDKVEPKEGSTTRGGTIYVAADNNARVFVNGTFVGECYGFDPPSEIIVAPNLLKAGENVISIQAANVGSAAADPMGLSVVADFGGVDGRGAGFGGVTLTTRTTELDRWSTSYRNVSGLLGKVQFDVRQGSALSTRTDNLSRMNAVMQTLSGLLGATLDRNSQQFQALR